jgi:hypothetical protein
MNWLNLAGHIAMTIMLIASLSLAATSATRLYRGILTQKAFMASMSNLYQQKRRDAELQRLTAKIIKNGDLSRKELDTFFREAEKLLESLPPKDVEVIAAGLHQDSEDGKIRYARKIILGAGSASRSGTHAAA